MKNTAIAFFLGGGERCHLCVAKQTMDDNIHMELHLDCYKNHMQTSNHVIKVTFVLALKRSLSLLALGRNVKRLHLEAQTREVSNGTGVFKGECSRLLYEKMQNYFGRWNVGEGKEGLVKIFSQISLNTVLALKKLDLEMTVLFLFCEDTCDRDCFDTHLMKPV